MTRKYEVYVNGVLAKRSLTTKGAEKVADRFPAAKVEIYRIIPTVQSELIYRREGERICVIS